MILLRDSSGFSTETEFCTICGALISKDWILRHKEFHPNIDLSSKPNEGVRQLEAVYTSLLQRQKIIDDALYEMGFIEGDRGVVGALDELRKMRNLVEDIRRKIGK